MEQLFRKYLEMYQIKLFARPLNNNVSTLYNINIFFRIRILCADVKMSCLNKDQDRE